MDQTPTIRTALRWTLIATACSALLVVVCYYFVDRTVAYLVQSRGIDEVRPLKWLTYPPPIVQNWAPLVIALLAVRRAVGPWRRWQHALLVACVSLILADQFRTSMGYACGRYWPETWHDDNPSLIGTGAYGFHPFSGGGDAGSFPSGHAARIAGFGGVFWCVWPRRRWVVTLLATPMIAALVGMNYHFVSDVAAGAFLGSIVAVWTLALSGIQGVGIVDEH